MSAASFRYTARTNDGRVVRGTVRAESIAVATAELRRRSLFVTQVTGRPRFSVVGAKQRRRALRGFFRALGTLMRSGVALRTALLVAIEQATDRGFKESLRAILCDIEDGKSLSEALGRRPEDFTPLHVAMVAAGERGGVLDKVLERVAGILDKEHALRKRIQGSLAYPVIVGIGATALAVFLVAHVAPMFASLFERFGVALPPATRMLLALGRLFSSPEWWFVCAMVTLAGISAWRRLRRMGHAPSIDRFRLRIPVVGALWQLAAVARITRILGILLQSGVGVLGAIEVAIPVAGSPAYASALGEVSRGLHRGESLRAPMAQSGLFDPLTLALVAVGEESGTIDEMLLVAAGYVEIELEAALATLAAFLEPAFIGVVGLAVALLVFSIFLPLYTLIGSLT